MSPSHLRIFLSGGLGGVGLLLGIGLAGCGAPIEDAPEASSVTQPTGGVQKPNPEQRGCPLVFSKTASCAQLVWKRPPQLGRGNHLMVFFWPQNSEHPQEGYQSPLARVTLEAFMPSMGHGTHGQAQLQQRAEGVYELEGKLFSMSGPWEIRIHLGSATGELIETQVIQVRL